MNDEFTHSAEKVLRFANQSAERFSHGEIGTAHLLLGLIRLRYGVVAQVFKNLGVDLRTMRKKVEQRIDTPTTKRKSPRQLSKASELCIRYARTEAMDLQQEQIDAEHILLGLMRERRGLAGQVLEEMGLDLDEVREEIVDVLDHAKEDN